jgi:hypothetical protein
MNRATSSSRWGTKRPLRGAPAVQAGWQVIIRQLQVPNPATGEVFGVDHVLHSGELTPVNIDNAVDLRWHDESHAIFTRHGRGDPAGDRVTRAWRGPASVFRRYSKRIFTRDEHSANAPAIAGSLSWGGGHQ